MFVNSLKRLIKRQPKSRNTQHKHTKNGKNSHRPYLIIWVVYYFYDRFLDFVTKIGVGYKKIIVTKVAAGP